MKEKVMSVVLSLLLASSCTSFTCSAESTETQETPPALSEFETANVYWIFYKAPDTSKIEETAEQQRQEYIHELYRSGAAEKEVEQKSTEYYKELRLNYLKKAYKEAAEQVLTDIGADPSKAWCSSYTATIVCELDDEQLSKARTSALITSISTYTQPDLTPETPAFSNSEEFIDLLTKDENGNSVLPTDIKVDAVLDCSKGYRHTDYLVIYGLNSVKEIKNVIDCLNKQTKYYWENPIEDYSGCEYYLMSGNTLSKNSIKIAIFVDNVLPGFLKMSPSAYSDEVGFDVTPYISFSEDETAATSTTTTTALTTTTTTTTRSTTTTSTTSTTRPVTTATTSMTTQVTTTTGMDTDASNMFTDIIEDMGNNTITFKEHGKFRYEANEIANKLKAYKAGDEIIIGFDAIKLHSKDTPRIDNIFMLSYAELALGDMNGDRHIDAIDATCVLTEYSLLSTGGTSSLTSSEKTAADVNKDNKIDANDATLILGMYAYNSTTLTPFETMEEYFEHINNTPKWTEIKPSSSTQNVSASYKLFNNIQYFMF